MKNVNTDKLPNIQGENLDVREEPQINELALQMQRTSQKVSAMRKSEQDQDPIKHTDPGDVTIRTGTG